MIPLNNKLTHESIYVSPRDEAWDVDRIDRERDWVETGKKPEGETGECPWVDWADHPVARFNRGLSRYDLATVQEYFLPNEPPMKFRLKRIPPSKFEQLSLLVVGDGEKMEQHAPARREAIRLSLAGIEGLEGWEKIEKMDDEKMDALWDLLGELEWLMLGNAALSASRPLDPLEKKR